MPLAYLDYNAATPVDRRVLEAMNDVHTAHFANPSSTHGAGMQAAGLLDAARRSVAAATGAGQADVIFTSGATEANNMMISSVAGRAGGRRPRILYGATEHKSVIEPCVSLSQKDVIESGAVPVTPDGTADLTALRSMLEESPADMVSIMTANSETGVVNPVREIAGIVHGAGAMFHSDITQALGKIPVDVSALGIDAASCSSHKMYGPKGCGALIAARGVRRAMSPLILGGGQEGGLRSGTPNVPAIVGFGRACELAVLELAETSARVAALRDGFEARVAGEVPGVTINGKGAPRLPNTSSVRIEGVLADAAIANMRDIGISSGSACSSNTIEPSHVLVAMGLDRTAADECIRVSFGRHSTEGDVDAVIAEIARAAAHLRQLEARRVEGIA